MHMYCDKMVQNGIVDWSTARYFTVVEKSITSLLVAPYPLLVFSSMHLMVEVRNMHGITVSCEVLKDPSHDTSHDTVMPCILSASTIKCIVGKTSRG